MTTTRSKRLNPSIKTEEHKHEHKSERLIHTTNNATKSKNKITKENIVKTALNQTKTANVGQDSKPASTLPTGTIKRNVVTKEQIATLIRFIVKKKLTVASASRKAKMAYATAQKYYSEYQNDPEHKIPIPKTSKSVTENGVTQKKIEDLIQYIVHDNMSLIQATYKANINKETASKLYKMYREDPEHKIPTWNFDKSYVRKRYTQDQVNELIGYMVNDKMTLLAASKKADMSIDTARRYYHTYLQDPNHEIPVLRPSYLGGVNTYTNEQVKSLIGYIVDDGMRLRAASIKAKMNPTTARKYYQEYLDDPDHKIPTPDTKVRAASKKITTDDQVKMFFSHIIIGKLNVKNAAEESNMLVDSAYRLYAKYLKYPTPEIDTMDTMYTVEKMKKMVEYVQKEKMTMKSAAIKAKLSYHTACKFYHQYMNDPQHRIPVLQEKQYTLEDVKRLINCVEHEKMSVKSAAIKVEMSNDTACKYYNMYRNDPEHKIPTPMRRGQRLKNRKADKYLQFIAEIYKNNPSIKPMSENHLSESASPSIDIKNESMEEDSKTL